MPKYNDCQQTNAKTSPTEHKKIRRELTEIQWDNFNRNRRGDLNKLFSHRYGGEFYTFPNNKAGRADLRILLEHYATSHRVTKIAEMRAPWLTGDDLECFLTDTFRRVRRWPVQELGEWLELNETDRIKLRITTIGTIDCTPEERRLKRLATNKERRCVARKAAGATPHAESAARLKPWEKEGLTRRTYYRRRSQIGGTKMDAENITTRVQICATSNTSESRARASHGHGQVGGTSQPLNNLTRLRPMPERLAPPKSRISDSRRAEIVPQKRKAA
jgi:hypothetical protein